MQLFRQCERVGYLLVVVGCSSTSVTQVTPDESGGSSTMGGTTPAAGTSSTTHPSGGTSSTGGTTTAGGYSISGGTSANNTGGTGLGGTANGGTTNTLGGATSGGTTNTSGGTTNTSGGTASGGTKTSTGGTQSTGGVSSTSTGPTCSVATSGKYCGGHGVTGGNPGSLYSCVANVGVPSSVQLCIAGCQVNSAGTQDACKPVPTCNSATAGYYCGGDSMSNADANTLYRCTGAGLQGQVSQVCAGACITAPPGQSDHC